MNDHHDSMFDPATTPIIPRQTAPLTVPTGDFRTHGTEGWHRLRESCQELCDTLQDVYELGTDDVGRKVRAMQTEIQALSPAITFIGQIKSGKTTLVNALAGQPGLLPADVNPWTSVVTSLFLNQPLREDSPTARFRFFDSTEWAMLVRSGGRIGELSERTGADRERERLQLQVQEIYEKTKARLGRSFELLMGQEHAYAGFDEDLIERYVCLGDAFDDKAAANGQGQYADITKAADLYLNAPHLPMGAVLRDTPGTNDTFLMREQITIRAVRDARLSVVVLSAHQALNSMDMALIRMIANLKQRQIVLFVNRIDELANPETEIPEIRASLSRTLSQQAGLNVPTILFGSGLWANAALEDTIDDLPEDSLAVLDQISAEHAHISDLRTRTWHASGLPQLHAAMAERVEETAHSRTLPVFRKRAANIVLALRAAIGIVGDRIMPSGEPVKLDPAAICLIDKIENAARQKMEETLAEGLAQFNARTNQAHAMFLNRAVSALQDHIEANGEDSVWNYSPDGLRMLVRTAHQVMRRNMKTETQKVFKMTADGLINQYASIFGIARDNFAIQPPDMPDVPPPVGLAQTIVLDVKKTWWKSWWTQRKGVAAYAETYRTLIESETQPLITTLQNEMATEIHRLVMETLEHFISDQRVMLDDLRAKSEISLDELHDLFGVTTQQEREDMFNLLCEELDVIEAAVDEDAA
ncbi:MAG: dynamin family protein [Pseudomonadota bacterium]